jgi:hypothetical protein
MWVQRHHRQNTLLPDHNDSDTLTTGQEDHAEKIARYLTNKGYDAFFTNGCLLPPSHAGGDWRHVGLTVEGAVNFRYCFVVTNGWQADIERMPV